MRKVDVHYFAVMTPDQTVGYLGAIGWTERDGYELTFRAVTGGFRFDWKAPDHGPDVMARFVRTIELGAQLGARSVWVEDDHGRHQVPVNTLAEGVLTLVVAVLGDLVDEEQRQCLNALCEQLALFVEVGADDLADLDASLLVLGHVLGDFTGSDDVAVA